MLLIIHNLPSNMQADQVKAFIKSRCGVNKFVMDKLVPDSHGNKVKIGIVDKSMGCKVMQKLNGLCIDGKRLWVEDVYKIKDTSLQPPSKFINSDTVRITHNTALSQNIGNTFSCSKKKNTVTAMKNIQYIIQNNINNQHEVKSIHETQGVTCKQEQFQGHSNKQQYSFDRTQVIEHTEIKSCKSFEEYPGVRDKGIKKKKKRSKKSRKSNDNLINFQEANPLRNAEQTLKREHCDFDQIHSPKRCKLTDNGQNFPIFLKQNKKKPNFQFYESDLVLDKMLNNQKIPSFIPIVKQENTDHKFNKNVSSTSIYQNITTNNVKITGNYFNEDFKSTLVKFEQSDRKGWTQSQLAVPPSFIKKEESNQYARNTSIDQNLNVLNNVTNNKERPSVSKKVNKTYNKKAKLPTKYFVSRRFIEMKKATRNITREVIDNVIINTLFPMKCVRRELNYAIYSRFKKLRNVMCDGDSSYLEQIYRMHYSPWDDQNFCNVIISRIKSYMDCAGKNTTPKNKKAKPKIKSKLKIKETDDKKKVNVEDEPLLFVYDDSDVEMIEIKEDEDNTIIDVENYVFKNSKKLQHPEIVNVISPELKTMPKYKPKKNCFKCGKSGHQSKECRVEQIIMGNNQLLVRAPSRYMIPKFDEPCKILVEELKELIKTQTSDPNDLFFRVLDFEICTRIARVLEGKTVAEAEAMPTQDIINLYHENYDPSKNEKFVKNTFKVFLHACWPSKENVKDGVYLEEFESYDDDTNDEYNSGDRKQQYSGKTHSTADESNDDKDSWVEGETDWI